MGLIENDAFATARAIFHSLLYSHHSFASFEPVKMPRSSKPSTMSSKKKKKRVKNKAELADCCKNLVGRLYGAGKRDERTLLRLLLASAGIDVPVRTLQKWAKKTKEIGSAFRPNAHPGAHRKMTREIEELVAGFVIAHIEDHQPTTNREAHKWLTLKLGIDISCPLVCRTTRRLGFSSRTVKTKTSGYKELSIERAPIYSKFIERRAHPVFSRLPLEKIGSIDFTYTSHKKDSRRTLGYTDG